MICVRSFLGAASAYLGGIIRISIAADKPIINIHLNNSLSVNVLSLVNVDFFNKSIEFADPLFCFVLLFDKRVFLLDLIGFGSLGKNINVFIRIFFKKSCMALNIRKDDIVKLFKGYVVR